MTIATLNTTIVIGALGTRVVGACTEKQIE